MKQKQIKSEISKAYRFYEVELFEILAIPIYYYIKVIGLKNQSLQQLIQTGNIITNETIKALFKDHFFEITNQEATHFSRILNIMRVTKSVNEIPFHPERTAVVEALKILKKNLPEAILYTKGELDNYNPYALKSRIIQEEHLLADYLKLSETVNTINIISQIENKSVTKAWHIDMMTILLMILNFTHSRQIKPSVKWSDAPAIIIIKRSLEIANVVSVDNDAIVKAIKRYPDIHYIQHLVQ